MQDQPIQGRPIAGNSSPTSAEDARDQGVVLTHVLLLHPTHLKLPDLVLEKEADCRNPRQTRVARY